MGKEGKIILSMFLFIIGSFMLWGSLFIGFIDWTYSMGFFRVSIAGLVMIIIATYLRFKWNLK